MRGRNRCIKLIMFDRARVSHTEKGRVSVRRKVRIRVIAYLPFVALPSDCLDVALGVWRRRLGLTGLVGIDANTVV